MIFRCLADRSIPPVNIAHYLMQPGLLSVPLGWIWELDIAAWLTLSILCKRQLFRHIS